MPKAPPPPHNLVTKDDQKKIARMLGRRFACQGKIPETDAAKILALAAQIRRGREKNPYQVSFHRFLTGMVFTKDEAKGGQVRQFPDYPYFHDLCDDAMIEPLQMWEKARRVLASWLVCSLDCWLLAGGQDPRWPALMNATENRQVILAARKLEDIQGSAWFLEERVRFVYTQIEERNLRDTHWPNFPEIKFGFAFGRASNGGRINAVPQGADQMRGPGATLIHAEECAFWDSLKKTISGALPVLQGGGHWLGISTANAASYCREIVQDMVDP